ncbi:Mini-ribonuclease 3 [Nodosilinea sp. FACHB-141]|uniref:Mini-ribonuclease 3 n=1 Tax=Leptolyngbya subtilissima DQ-A4 TaxID=2933933 RepID=A0ABV0K2W3_9CYAN|nr:ribonuclease III domain-containing protein [Nodosilinea sp. FACHB-141]
MADLTPEPSASLLRLLQFGAYSPAGSLTLEQVNALSPVALAYIGDAVYELFVRGSFLLPPKRIQAFHQQVVNQVRAEQQAYQVQQLLPLLTAAEQDLLRRGRNASSRGPRRVDSQIYQQSTAFEALIGYLYLTDQTRLAELLNTLELSVTPPSSQASPENSHG